MTDEHVPIKTDIIGSHGQALYLPYENLDLQDKAHVCAYLITSPHWHPLWSQYFLCVVHLREVEGVAPPKLRFDGATHEMIVMALSPDKHISRQDALDAATTGLPHLTPINMADQFEATDEEMQKLAWLCAQGVVEGRLCPETADGPTIMREMWLTACLKTLAHMRGEVHAP